MLWFGSRKPASGWSRPNKRANLQWISQTATAATRAKRITDAADQAGRGERAR